MDFVNYLPYIGYTGSSFCCLPRLLMNKVNFWIISARLHSFQISVHRC